MNKFALGIDVGGTKVAIATVGEDLSVHQKQEVMTHADNGEKLWENIEEVISDFLNSESGSLLGIGVASAGPLNIPQGTLSPVNIPIWRDFPIISRLKKMSNGSKVALHGDALALAHAEHKIGAGRGLDNMIGMVVSTGIGGGLILDGKVFPGETGNSCYIGHHSINFEGRVCACGRKGCVEAYSSGPQMVAIAHENGWAPQLDSFIDLAQSAREGNTIAIDAISQGTRALSIGIVNFVGTLDINHVVIGGGVAQAGEIFWEPLQKHIETESKAIGFLKNIQLRKAELERDAGILGAALAVLS
jgi:glucokinase